MEKNGLEGKRTVLKLTLEGPIIWDWNEGVQTANLSLPFKVLQDKNQLKNVMAERVGFEPTLPLPVNRISSAAHSTTLPPLREVCRARVRRVVGAAGDRERAR